MPSAVRKRSSDSLTIFSLGKVQVAGAIENFVSDLSRRDEVLKVVVFGSWIRGETGVGSNVDFLIVLRESRLPFLERIPLYIPADFPIDVDVFPYTVEELKGGVPLAEQALKEGKPLFERERR